MGRKVAILIKDGVVAVAVERRLATFDLVGFQINCGFLVIGEAWAINALLNYFAPDIVFERIFSHF